MNKKNLVFNISKLRVEYGSKKWERNILLGAGTEECVLCGRATHGEYGVLSDINPDIIIRIDEWNEELDEQCETRLLSDGKTHFQSQGFGAIGPVCRKKIPSEFVTTLEFINSTNKGD